MSQDLHEMLLMDMIFGEPFYKRSDVIGDTVKELVPSIPARIKEYFASKIDKDHPTASLIDDLAPGAIWATMSLMGLGKWGVLIGLLLETFHVDVNGLLSSIFGGVKSLLNGGNKVSSSQVNNIVDSAIQEHSNDAQEAIAMHDAKIVRLAMIDYEHQVFRLTNSKIALGAFTSKGKATSLLGRIFGFILKVALGSLGLMLAGDAINKLLGRPNSFDKNFQQGKEGPVPTASEQPYTATQTKFPLKSDAPLPPSVPENNTPDNIEQALLQFAKDTYDGLDGKESTIVNDPIFQTIKQRIVWYNSKDTGYSVIFIPPYWKTKKQLVDNFIDDVAKRA
jgi:hypothetical protein